MLSDIYTRGGQHCFITGRVRGSERGEACTEAFAEKMLSIEFSFPSTAADAALKKPAHSAESVRIFTAHGSAVE